MFDGTALNALNGEMTNKSPNLTRGSGVTPSEQYLRRLCETTFLSLWSHANVFRNPGQELCDLLVVCDNDVVIFSDKYCRFPETENLRNDWNRWFKRAVVQSAKQAWGAERWLRDFPERAYLEPRCTSKLPIEIPPSSQARYHIVVVAHGWAERFAKPGAGGHSLPVDSWVRGRIHFVPEGEPIRFAIGDIDPKKTFVHVLTERSVSALLRTRDTITDFVSYLRKKEKLFREPYRILADGEEDLLSFYLKNVNESEEHDFVFERARLGLRIESGHWQHFESRPERKRQLEANDVSYVWDRLIETFAGHAWDGTQYFAVPSGVDSSERILRFMAKEDRTSRRMLAKAFLGIVAAGVQNDRATRYIVGGPSQVRYVFLTLKKMPYMDEDGYRVARRSMLDACCMALKLRDKPAEHIVGIATEPGFDLDGRSEDAMYMDTRSWTAKEYFEAEEVVAKLGIGKNLNQFHVHEDEYPDN